MATDDEDDTDEDGVETQSIPRHVPKGRTGPTRALTQTDAEKLARAQAEATAKALAGAEAARALHNLELQSAEWFGREGDGGKIAAMAEQIANHETALEKHGHQIAKLMEFKGRLIWLGGAALTVGGVIAALASHLIEKAFFK